MDYALSFREVDRRRIRFAVRVFCGVRFMIKPSITLLYFLLCSDSPSMFKFFLLYPIALNVRNGFERSAIIIKQVKHIV